MKTYFSPFEEVYNHIDAPTKHDEEFFKNHKKRILYDIDDDINHYRDNSIFLLRNNLWNGSRKLDGTNFRIKYDGEKAIYCGKTNKAQFTDDQKEYIESVFLEELFEEKFRVDDKDLNVIIYGELVGEKIQNGDRNEFKDLEVVIFDVKINDVWLEPDSVKDIAKFFNLKSSYDFIHITGILKELVKFVIDNKDRIEGLVATPVGGFYSKKQDRIIVKIKGRDYE